MQTPLFLDALRLVAATYLLVLAVAALLGAHRGLLAYPFQAAYSVVRILVIALTFGRVRLTKQARRARRRSGHRFRETRSVLTDFRERRAEERALAHGENPFTDGGWASTAAPAPAPAAPPAAAAVPQPAPPPPATPRLPESDFPLPEEDESADEAPPRLY